MIDVQQFKPVLWVTFAYLVLYYAFMINVLRVKLKVAASSKALGVKFDRYQSTDPALRAADRVQLNTLEHMPPFLILLWLDAAMGSVMVASLLGWTYVGLRALYPVFLGSQLNRNIPNRLLINTFASYLVLAALMGHIVYCNL
ncbi:MAG: MAPEG family protein [Bradymonadia bacterium]